MDTSTMCVLERTETGLGFTVDGSGVLAKQAPMSVKASPDCKEMGDLVRCLQVQIHGDFRMPPAHPEIRVLTFNQDL